MGQGASIGGVEVEKPEGLSIEDVTNGNVALVFVKPHACNEAMVQFVKEELVKKKLVILGETPLGEALPVVRPDDDGVAWPDPW